MNYNKMIAVNKAESQQKVAAARKAIKQSLDTGEKISVAVLIKRTGLSRGFFYKNEEVRAEMDRAIQEQKGGRFPNPHIGAKPKMDKEEELRLKVTELEAANEELSEKNDELYQKIKRLEQRLGQREIGILKKI